MNEFLKRRIITVSIFLVLIMIISSFFIKGEGISESVSEAMETGNSLIISNTENGSIGFEENEYFNKYTISCNEVVTDLKSKEDKDKFQITLDKSKISNIDIKKGSKANLSEINYEDNENSFILNFKKLTEDENYVHLDNLNNKKIVIFIKKKKTPYKYKVVIDPGHGGVDIGASYGKLLEKNLTIKISNYMVDNLRYNGCEVIFTRHTDIVLDKLVKQDLIKRAAIANDQKADIFISVHVNSGNTEYNGVSTYYYDPAGFQTAQRIKLAQIIQKEILKSDKWKNMGEHKENYSVLRNTKMPSVLVECGFIDNSSDRSKLSKEETLADFGLNISNGIIKYLAEDETTKTK